MRRLFLITVISLICDNIFSQTQNEILKKVNITSPTAAGIGKYVDVPVGHHTGIPDVSVPIYTVKDGTITIPISLSYHAGGIKLAELSSWVGLGWSLNAGGAISRSVNGLPDDRASLSSQVSGYFSEYGLENNVLYDSSSPISIEYLDDNRFTSGLKDGEPDLFSFNFNGYSGKFYFRDDRTPVLVPQQDLKIITHTTNNIHITAFTIITPDGIQYEFGRTSDTSDVDPVEQTNVLTPSDPAINQNTISTWYLNRITNSTGIRSVVLKYQEEKYTYFDISMPTLTGTNDSLYDHKLIKQAIKGVRLSEINFSSGQVLFNSGNLREDVGGYVYGQDFYTESSNTEAKSLANIEITNGIDCKRFYLNYGYFIDSTTSLPSTLSITTHNIDKKRLKLLNVSERTCDSTKANGTTQFTYFSEFLPRRLNFGSDHWGFPNGALSNTKVTSTYTIDTFTTVSGANREPHWPEMRAGSLKAISYPTGGRSEFEFEPHTTWVSSTKYNQSFVCTSQMGYDGGSTAVVSYHTLNANYHKFLLKNSNCSPEQLSFITCFSSLHVYDSATNQEVLFMTADVNTTKTKIAYLPASTYRFEVWKDKGTYTGTGVIDSVYELDPYTYSRNDTVGGLRIKSVNQYTDSSVTPLTTNYNYTYSNGHSAGVLYSRPTYVQVLRNEQVKQIGVGGAIFCSPNGCMNCDISSQQYYEKSGSPLVPMKNSQGNHIGYSQVKVSKEGNGYSIYKFFGSELWEDLHDDIAYKNVNLVPPCSASLPNWPAAPIPFEYKRGELKEEQYFNEEGNILSEKWYSYSYEDVPETFTTARIMLSPQGYEGGGRITDYELMAKKKTKEEVVSREYSMADGSILSTTDSTLYESPYHNSATKTMRFNSKGDTLVTKYKYVLDFYKDTCQSISSCFTSFINDYNYYTSNFQYAVATGCGSDWACKWNSWHTYRLNRVSIRKAYLACRASNFMNPANTYDSCINNAITNADTLLKPILWLQKKGRNALIESTTWNNSNLTSASFLQYGMLNDDEDQLYIKRVEKINIQTPSTTYQNSTVSGNTINRDSRFVTDVELKASNDNLLQATSKGNNVTSYIWDYQSTFPIAQVANAGDSAVAFTSFEAEGKGGWSYSGSADTSYKLTGKKSYLVSNGSVTKSGLASTNYIVSYWGRNGSVSVNGNGPSKTGKSIGNWTYYEHELTTTGVTVSGSNYIDELRLYPKTAQMITYTYNPLVGMTSQCDVSNKIVFYEYDEFNRLKIIRDEDSNILKRICYNYAGEPENCIVETVYGNEVQSQAFYRNNCDTCSTGSQVTYTVPASTYTSTVSQAAANTLAQDDISANGQNYANTNGSCTATKVTITFSNTASASGFTAVYTNTSTSQTYSFSIPSSGSGTLGCIPAGTYSLSISKPGNFALYLFGSGCHYTSDTSAYFGSVSVSSSTDCTIVTIDGAW